MVTGGFQERLEGIARHLGIGAGASTPTEKLVSAVGGFVAILGIFFASSALLEGPPLAMIVASMGASAVLLFAVPHGPLSQPWALVAGHAVSALVGVPAAALIPEPLLAGAAAVGGAIGAMHLLRCIHPPGGATALTAVVGGEAVSRLGYSFLLLPVMWNVAVILLIAVVFNYPFRWRRYPVSLAPKGPAPAATGERGEAYPAIAHADLVYALSEIDSFIDVSEQDLLRIYDLATRHAALHGLALEQVKSGLCYSNGRFGDDWGVRQVSALRVRDDGVAEVAYRVVAGVGRRRQGVTTLQEFARWAAYRVVRVENSWQRVEDDESA